MRLRPTVLPLVAVCLLGCTQTLVAQSVTSGAISGTVRERSLDLGLYREATSDASGRFRFTFVVPGEYELRVETLGFRPTVVGPIDVEAGDTRSVDVSITAATPPVVETDTLRLGGDGGSSRWRRGGTWTKSGLMSTLPSLAEDLGAFVGLSSAADDALGAQGLPGSFSRFIADGVPFYRAAHPRMRGESLGPSVFPRNAVSGLGVVTDAGDVEGSGAAGADLVTTTLVALPNGAEVAGGWSGAPLWSSSQVDVEAPALTSFWGMGRASVEISPDTSRFFVAAEGMQSEVPTANILSDEVAAGLNGVDPDLLSRLGGPSVARISRFSGLGRLDWWASPTRRFFIRAAVSQLTRDYDLNGPAMDSYGGGLPEESTEFSVAAGVVSEIAGTATLDLRAGVSGSDRAFSQSVTGIPTTLLVGSGSNLGSVPFGSASAQRLDVYVTPVVHLSLAGGEV
ncbi:MAG: carboxypeptidase-like regulatory domain-containing protein, partial [Planctomycetota bacterium]